MIQQFIQDRIPEYLDDRFTLEIAVSAAGLSVPLYEYTLSVPLMSSYYDKETSSMQMLHRQYDLSDDIRNLSVYGLELSDMHRITSQQNTTGASGSGQMWHSFDNAQSLSVVEAPSRVRFEISSLGFSGGKLRVWWNADGKDQECQTYCVSDDISAIWHEYENDGIYKIKFSTNLLSIDISQNQNVIRVQHKGPHFDRISAANCYNLQDITIYGLSTLDCSKDMVADCFQLTAASFPDLQQIDGKYAMGRARNLQTFHAPRLKALTTKGGALFKGDVSIKSLSFPELSSLSNDVKQEDRSYQFQALTSLTSIYLPNLLDTSYWMFQACINLVDVNVNSLEYIGNGAFQGCSSLKNLKLPSVKRIDVNAFSFCDNLEILDLRGVGDEVPSLLSAKSDGLSVKEAQAKGIFESSRGGMIDKLSILVMPYAVEKFLSEPLSTGWPYLSQYIHGVDYLNETEI